MDFFDNEDGELTGLFESILRANGPEIATRIITRLTNIAARHYGPSASTPLPAKRSATAAGLNTPQFSRTPQPIDVDTPQQSTDHSSLYNSNNNSTMSQGGNLMLENSSGPPMRDELMNLRKSESHFEKEITFKSIYFMKGDNTGDVNFYIPSESVRACHSIEVINEKMTDVISWKPLSATVEFNTARSWLTPPPGNATNQNPKDVGDFCMKFLKLGDEAPLNLTIFEKTTDWTTWSAYTHPTGLPTFTGITRKITTGLSPYGSVDINDNDPGWHSEVMGRGTFGRFQWKHENQIDSPPKFRNSIYDTYINNVLISHNEIPSVNPVNYIIVGNEDKAVMYSFRRFDYIKGFLVKPKVCLESRADKILLSDRFATRKYVDATPQDIPVDICIAEDFETVFCLDKKFGLSSIINNDVDSRLTSESNVSNNFIPLVNTNAIGDRIYANTFKREQFQQYFENNVMRPIIYRPQKIAYTAGNLPVEYTYQVEITHKIIAKCSNRYGLPNDIYTNMQLSALAAKAPKFTGQNLYRDKSKNILF